MKFNSAKSIGDDIVERYRNKEIDSVKFIYNKFKSIGSQVIQSEKMFPLEHHNEENEEPSTNNI